MNQFIVYRRSDKAPVDYRTGNPANAHDPANWGDVGTAQAASSSLGDGYGIGFVLTEQVHIAVIDVDGCRNPQTGEITLIAQTLIGLLPGAYVEISISGRGIHIWFTYTGVMPPHGSRTSGIGEFYHKDRYICIGAPYEAPGFINGSLSKDHTDSLPGIIGAFFPPDKVKVEETTWDGPVPEWRGPTDDAELIRRAMRPTANSAFGSRASFGDLWTANTDVLGKTYPDANGRDYDASAADAALAQHLSFWTGKDVGRIERLMRQSALIRDKWDSHTTYMERTITGAVARQEAVLGDKEPTTALSSAPGPSLTVPSGTPNELTPDDFWAHLPSHKYINRLTREMIPVDAINSHLKRFTEGHCQSFKPAQWLDMFRAVQQMSWHPGYPEIIEGMVSDNGTLRADPKGRIFNRFRPSDAVSSDADASRWVNHIKYIYPTDHEYIISWFAYRVQNPGSKINHAMVLGGVQGTGKDFILSPLRYAVGASNCETVKPTELFSQFTDYVEKTLVVINEARDLGDENRYSFYETTKPLIAGPPDTLRCNLKGLTPYSVPNVMAVVITTNNKLNGIYLPPDDRRHYVAYSPLPQKPGDAYFDPLWDWMDEQGGKAAVMGYLQRLDISRFSPKGDPPKTEAWHQIVSASVNPEETSMSDAIEGIQIATVKQIILALTLKGHNDLAQNLQKNARKIPQMLERIGLEILRNPNAKADGRWRLGDGRKETLYVDKTLPLSEGYRLAQAMTLKP